MGWVEDVIDHGVASSVRLSHRGTAITLHMATIDNRILQTEAAGSKLFQLRLNVLATAGGSTAADL